jgi:hypothetical protein
VLGHGILRLSLAEACDAGGVETLEECLDLGSSVSRMSNITKRSRSFNGLYEALPDALRHAIQCGNNLGSGLTFFSSSFSSFASSLEMMAYRSLETGWDCRVMWSEDGIVDTWT